jgi:hypothetical protein
MLDEDKIESESDSRELTEHEANLIEKGVTDKSSMSYPTITVYTSNGFR